MGVSVNDLIRSGSVASMLMVKLEGVGEGIFAELAKDMLGGTEWLL